MNKMLIYDKKIRLEMPWTLEPQGFVSVPKSKRWNSRFKNYQKWTWKVELRLYKCLYINVLSMIIVLYIGESCLSLFYLSLILLY